MSNELSLSSVCSGDYEADINDSLEDLDRAGNICDVSEEDKVSSKMVMDLGFAGVRSEETIDIKRDDGSFGSPSEDTSPAVDLDGQEVNDDNVTSESSKKQKAKKESRKCTVCGDRALGYNFDAITCESCKAFFRRNANKSKHPRCMFQGVCTIDSNTRRFCSACRLAKCFTVGMKKEMILGDDERQKRIEKVQQNRAKKLVQLQKQTGADLLAADPNAIYQIKDTPPSVDKLCRVKVETSTEPSRCSTADSTQWIPSTAQGIPQGAPLAERPMDSEDASRRLLLESDRQLIEHIGSAYMCSFGSTADEVPLQPETTSLEGLMNHIGTLVKILIRFAKKLNDFTTLPQSAQVALLKGASLDCITWRSAQLYDITQGKWVDDEGAEIPVQLLNSAFDHIDTNIQAEHISLISSIKELVGNDLTLVSLVQCVILFTPEYSAPGVRSLTSAAQDKYITLLKHYLQSIHNWTDAFAIFTRLLTYISATKVYASKHSKAFLECDASRVEPLLLEVFDLDFSIGP